MNFVKKIEFHVFIFYFFLIHPQLHFLDSQESNKFSPISLKFFVTHPWKKVEGTCNDLKLDKSKINLIGESYNLTVPFTISCNLNQMKTGDPNRDSHMLEVLGFPDNKEISLNFFKLKLNADRKYNLEAEITIKSTKRNIIIIASEDSIKSGRITGEFEVNLSDFKVERPSLLFIPINDKIKIQFDVQL